MAQEEHTKANTEVKMSVKWRNATTFINSLAEKAEKSAGSGNMRQLYATTRKLSASTAGQNDQLKTRKERTSRELNNCLIDGLNILKDF